MRAARASVTARQKGSAFKPHFPVEVERGRITGTGSLYDSFYNEPFGVFYLPADGRTVKLQLIVSDVMGWDHISVSMADGEPRCPTWGEMKRVKDLFFREDACVVQFHPPQDEYVNNHEYVLHLWHEHGADYRLPPRVLV